MSVTSPQVFLDGRVTLHAGDCLAVVKSLPDDSIDACVTDPPYALVSIGKRFGAGGASPCKPGATGVYQRASAGFMGKTWDTGETAFAVEFWAEIYRVLKPGAHVVAFGGTRSYHRLACAIEDAGFEIRDQIQFGHDSGSEEIAFLDGLNDEQRAQFAKLCERDDGGQLGWAYGSGFPKSHDVSKGIDKAAGATREVVAVGSAVKRMIPGANQNKAGWEKTDGREFTPTVTVAATEAAQAWQGWGTALKPAWEPICLARKPLSEGTVAANVLRFGTGAINIDATRVGFAGTEDAAAVAAAAAAGFAASRARGSARQSQSIGKESRDGTNAYDPFALAGRWPANIVHDGSAEVLAAFPDSNGQRAAVGPQHGAKPSVNVFGDYGPRETFEPRNDSGSAARFFYSAKADSDDRIGSKHPTVKPVDLMQWLCRLVCPPDGTILDPFAGTGTTGEAAWREGFAAILIEREAEYCADVARRMALAGEGKETRKRDAAKARAGDASPDFGPLFGGEAASAAE